METDPLKEKARFPLGARASCPLSVTNEPSLKPVRRRGLISVGEFFMKIEVLADANSVALRAASLIAEEARAAVAARGRFVMAVSGGHTPWVMLRCLGG